MSRQIPLDATLRPETYDALWATDRYGEDQPRRLGMFPLVATAVQGGVRCKVVPESYWREASDFEHHAQAVVDCPCGQTVIVELVVDLRPCPGCRRWFFYAGPEVFALNSPAE